MLVNFGQIWEFWAILGNLSILGQFGHFGQIWANLGILGNSGLSGKFGRSGQIWAFWEIPGILVAPNG